MPLWARAEGAGVALGASWEEDLGLVVLVDARGMARCMIGAPIFIAERGIEGNASASCRPCAGASIDDAVGP